MIDTTEAQKVKVLKTTSRGLPQEVSFEFAGGCSMPSKRAYPKGLELDQCNVQLSPAYTSEYHNHHFVGSYCKALYRIYR